jgi:para-aminobenzoate synthetase/4-amino-4-deoxychorismate lyase
MVRNDMGRIAIVGSVQVPQLFKIEKYPNVWQMTSTIASQTKADLCDIFQALFPCASITGAPKIKTMQIIVQCETSPRKIYTGCIGFIAPGRKIQFNVAIRTVFIDKLKGEAEYGVGSGIVWDSDIHDEYKECMVKASVLYSRCSDFSLIESTLWTPQKGYFLLDLHLKRLFNSGRYFGFLVNIGHIREKLLDFEKLLPNNPQKVRFLVSKQGDFSCSSDSLITARKLKKVKLAMKPVDSADPFLYHKTTYREIYQTHLSTCQDCDDVLLWNERGEITEACTSNFVVLLDNKLVTPHIHCGLLPGTFRSWLLEKKAIQEKIIKINMLNQSSFVYLINSVHKWQKATFLR